jgi:hypothetical protein
MTIENAGAPEAAPAFAAIGAGADFGATAFSTVW